MSKDYLRDKQEVVIVVVVGCKANCPLVGPGLIGCVPSVGVFLMDPSPYLHEFRRKP